MMHLAPRFGDRVTKGLVRRLGPRGASDPTIRALDGAVIHPIGVAKSNGEVIYMFGAGLISNLEILP